MDNIQDKMIFKDTDEFMAPCKDGKYAIYSNKEQKFITDYLFEKISYIPVRNYFVVRKDGQNMVIDTQGNKIDFPIYYPNNFTKEALMHYRLNKGAYPVVQNGKVGVIDTNGKVIVPFEYKSVTGISDELMLVTNFDNEEGFIDKYNNIVVPFGKFKDCHSFNNGMAQVNSDDLGEVYINKEGKPIIKVITETTHFIYYVTAEKPDSDAYFNVAVKDKYAKKFKKAISLNGFNVVLKLYLTIYCGINYKRLIAVDGSPYKISDLERLYIEEIRRKITNGTTKYLNEEICFYDYAAAMWDELNPENILYYETPNQQIGWITAPLDKTQTGLPMNVELVLQSMGKIENEPPYLIVQNDYEDKRNYNWIKMRLNGEIINGVKPRFNEYIMEDLKHWIEVNKLAILLYWTQEIIDYGEISKLIKNIGYEFPRKNLPKEWKSTRIINAKPLEEYFASIKDKIIGKTIDKIFYTGELYNSMWDEYFEYKNGEWYCEGEKSNEPSYYPWKESRTVLWLDSPVILDFEGTRLEIEYWTGSLVNVNINSIDTDLYGADVSKNFMRNIIGKKLIDIEINKTDKVYFMNFSHLGIERKDGDDMFDEIRFEFENGYGLEIKTDHCDYTIFEEVR